MDSESRPAGRPAGRRRRREGGWDGEGPHRVRAPAEGVAARHEPPLHRRAGLVEPGVDVVGGEPGRARRRVQRPVRVPRQRVHLRRDRGRGLGEEDRGGDRVGGRGDERRRAPGLDAVGPGPGVVEVERVGPVVEIEEAVEPALRRGPRALSVSLSLCLSVSLSLCLSVCQSVSLSVSLFVSLSVSLLPLSLPPSLPPSPSLTLHQSLCVSSVLPYLAPSPSPSFVRSLTPSIPPRSLTTHAVP